MDIDKQSGVVNFSQALLPETLHFLCVTEDEPDWVQFALALNSAGCLEPRFRWAASVEVALSELRNTTFDCLLVEPFTETCKTSSGQPDPLAVVRAMRSIGHDDPVVVLCDTLDDRTTSLVLGLDCECLTSTAKWESPLLAQLIHRAIAKTELEKELQQLSIERRRRVQSERKQAEHLLTQQRATIQQLAENAIDSAEQASSANIESSYTYLSAAYCDLLKTYVVLEPGRLTLEVERLADEMSQLGFSPQEVLKLHHEQTTKLIENVGEKSSLHIITQAGALGMELLAQLGERYQRKTAVS